MRVTVDASVVVKWFVAEPMCEEARHLLASRIHLHAPDLVLVEFANTIWKKVRRKELPEAKPYLKELVALPDIIDLQLSNALIERAAQIALEIDHPIYDCLYIACAEITDSAVITADRRFSNKASPPLVGIPVHHISAPNVVDQLKGTAAMLVIEEGKLEELIAIHDFFAETERSVLDELFSGREGPHVITDKDRGLFLDSPPYRRLVDSVRELHDDERIDLNALGWLGAGLFSDWRQSVAHAEKMSGGLDAEYTAGYGRHWRAGYKRATEK